LAGWAAWIGLSLLSCLIILAGHSYPALVFRSTLTHWVAGPLRLVSWIPQRMDLKRENAELRRRATVLFVENCRLEEQAREAGRLEELLRLRPRPGLGYLPARVLARSSPFGPQSVVLDRGRADGLGGGEALATPWGLCGLVAEAGDSECRALLLSHRDFRLRALLARTREEGILAGGAEELELQDIPFSSPVAAGDTVLSAWAGTRFPGGMPVGVVSRVLESGGLFREVRVQPLARLASLEEVYIVRRAGGDSLFAPSAGGPR
jgi:rod shape-determining protein MreC